MVGVIVRNPTQDELPTVLEVLCGAFGEEPRERFRKQIWEDSTFALEQIRIAEVNGKIVSHVWVAERPVFFRGQAILPMGGIGGVGTIPEYRQRGLATLLLQDAIAYMERKGHAVSILFTDINPFYAKLGWADFPEWRFRLTVRRVPDENEMPEGYEVRPCDFDDDLPALQAIHRRHIQALQISLPHARPDAFWRNGHPRHLGLQPSHAVVTKPETGNPKQVVAYACAFGTEQGVCISEFAYDHKHPLSVQALAIALAKEAKADDKKGVIEGGTTWLHPLPQTLATLTDATLSHHIGEHMMLRIVNLRQCLEAAQPLMEADLQAAKADNLSGSFCFQLTQPEQAVTTKVQGGKVAISETDVAEVTLPVTPRKFCLLFFGAVPAQQWKHLLAQKGVELTEEQITLLSLLFPPHPTIYWSSDHF